MACYEEAIVCMYVSPTTTWCISSLHEEVEKQGEEHGEEEEGGGLLTNGGMTGEAKTTTERQDGGTQEG